MVAAGCGLKMTKEAVPVQVRRGGKETVTVPAAGGKVIGVHDRSTTPTTCTSRTGTKTSERETRRSGTIEYRLDFLSIELLSAQTMNAVGMFEIFVVGTASLEQYPNFSEWH